MYTSSPESKKRRRYQILSPADKAEVGRYATQHFTPQTVAHFKDKYDLKATSVRNFKVKYLKEFSRKRKLFRDSEYEVLELTLLKVWAAAFTR